MANNLNSNSGLFGMPKQKVSLSEKDEKWRRDCVDGIIGMSGQMMFNGRSNQWHKQVNYDLVNGIFDEEDMKYVTDPYGIGEKLGNQPARMTCYPIIPSKLNLLDGEELKRPFNFRVICTGGEGSSIRNEKKMKLLLDFYKNKLYTELGIKPEDVQNPQFQNPQQLVQWFDQTYEDMREQMSNKLLRYLTFAEDLKSKFNKGFKHAKICAEEIYYISQIGGKPSVRVVNPLYFDFDRNPEIEFIEDSNWAKEERYMSVPQIADEFGKFLTDKQIDALEQGNFGFGGFSNQSAIASATMTFMPQDTSRNKTVTRDRQFGIPVITVVWQSLRQIGFLTYTDETGTKQTVMVDDDFKMSPELKKLKAVLEWEWKSETWKGTRIGTDIYVDVAPLANQVDGKLPYVGAIYNNLNSIATSLVDFMKPHQYLYNIVWYRLELELAKAKGKKFVMDLAQLPKSQGWDVDQWMYYFDNVGVAWINSLEEGGEGMQNQVAKFNQFQSIDMTLSQSVQQYMNILNKLEDMIGDLVGVTRQREGQSSSSETVGGVERSIVQSSMITEPLFYKHNQVKQRVYTQLLETAKLAYANGGNIDFLDNDFLRTVLTIDGEIFNDSQYGIFITDSQMEQNTFDKLQALAQQALQTGAITMSELITVFKSQSLSEVENVVKKGEARREQIAQQQSEQANQGAMQVQQAKDAAQANQNAWQADQNDKDRAAKLEEATIKALGFSKDTDANTDGVPDVIAQEELALKRQELVSKQANEQIKNNDKASADARKDQLASKKLDLDDRRMKQEDEQFNREQAQQDKKNAQDNAKAAIDLKAKQHDEKMKKLDIAMQLKEHAQADKEHKYKLKEAEVKLKQLKAKPKPTKAKPKK